MSLIQFIRKIIPGVNQFQPRLREVVDLDHERALAERQLDQSRESFDETMDVLLADIRRRKTSRQRGH